MDFTNTIGMLAGIFTTVSFLPQVIRSWKTRDLAGVSLAMYSLFVLGVALWLTYGILLGSWPVIVANSVTVVLAGAVLVLKLIHK